MSQGLAVTVGGTTNLGPGDWVLAWWLQGVYDLDELVPKKKKKEIDWDMGYIEDFRRWHSSRRDTAVKSWGSFSILLARAQGGMRSR